MEDDPFQGDVKPVQGPEWEGVFRKRIGDYRLLFTVDHGTRSLQIVRILRRSEKTYQRG